MLPKQLCTIFKRNIKTVISIFSCFFYTSKSVGAWPPISTTYENSLLNHITRNTVPDKLPHHVVRSTNTWRAQTKSIIVFGESLANVLIKFNITGYNLKRLIIPPIWLIIQALTWLQWKYHTSYHLNEIFWNFSKWLYFSLKVVRNILVTVLGDSNALTHIVNYHTYLTLGSCISWFLDHSEFCHHGYHYLWR